MKKRIMSMILAVGMLFSCVTVANASAFTQQSQAAQFNTFNGWEKTESASTAGETIVGWQDSSAKVGSASFATNRYGIKSVIDSVTGNVYASTMKNTALVHMFDEVVAKGMLHLSFDMMNKGTSDSDIFVVQTLMNSGNNLTAYPLNAAGTALDDSQVLNVRSSKMMVSGKEVTGAAATYMDGKFHKYDIVYDFEGDNFGIYADGVLIGEKVTINYGVKGLKFWDAKGDEANDLIDNLALYHYPTSAGITSVEMAADCGANGVLAAEGGKVNIAFSEYVSNYTPAVSDFKVVNLATGKVADVKGVAKADTGVVLTFDGLEAGEYEVSFVNENVVGAISGKKILGKASFTAVAHDVLQANDRYLLSESFDKYNGGMPAGWAPLLTTQTVAAEVQNLEKTAGVTGSALKVKESGDIFFEFPNPIASGELNVEFDINSADGIWGMGFLHGKDFADTTILQPNTLEADKTLDERRQRSLLVGNDAATDGDDVALKYKSNRDYENWFNHDEKKLYVNKNEWTHIKVKFDFEGMKCYLTVGDKTEAFGVNDKYFMAYPYKGITDTSYTTSFYGFKALRLAALGSAGVSVDNVSIYTTGAYNIYENFNSWNAGEHRASIFDHNNARLVSNHTIEAVAGRTGEAADKAIKITRKNANGLVMPLVSPIAKGKNFNVEFDFKQSGVADTDTFAIALFEKYDHLGKATYNLGASSFGNVGTNRIVFATAGYNTDGTVIKAGSLFFGSCGEAAARMPLFTAASDKKTVSQYDIEANKWYNVKIKVRNGLYQLEVTDEAGTTKTFYMIDKTQGEVGEDGKIAVSATTGPTASKRQNNNDTYAIGFFNPKATNAANAVTTIDNVKVYEIDAPTKASIASAKAVYADREESIGTTVNANVEKIELTVSTPLRSTGIAAYSAYNTYNALDDISFVYGDTGEAVSDNITISEDKQTITVTLDEAVSVNRPVVFEISNKALWSESHLSSEKNETIEFMFANPEEKITVNDFRIYEYQTADTVSGWTPVIKTTLVNYTADNQLKVSVSGRNDYASSKKLSAIFAVYNSENGRLEEVASKTVTAAANSNFELAIYSANTAATNMEDGTVTVDLTKGNKIKCFVWDLTDGVINPLKANLEYTKWTATVK